jgi:hypothetical protein
MRCDDCGRDIPSGQEVETTRSEQVGSPGPLGAPTSTEWVTLCPTCAGRRDRWSRVIAVVVGLLVLGGILGLIVPWR